MPIHASESYLSGRGVQVLCSIPRPGLFRRLGGHSHCRWSWRPIAARHGARPQSRQDDGDRRRDGVEQDGRRVEASVSDGVTVDDYVDWRQRILEYLQHNSLEYGGHVMSGSTAVGW